MNTEKRDFLFAELRRLKEIEKNILSAIEEAEKEPKLGKELPRVIEGEGYYTIKVCEGCPSYERRTDYRSDFNDLSLYSMNYVASLDDAERLRDITEYNMILAYVYSLVCPKHLKGNGYHERVRRWLVVFNKESNRFEYVIATCETFFGTFSFPTKESAETACEFLNERFKYKLPKKEQ